MEKIVFDKPDLKIGLFAIGLDAYWPQFPGLLERLESYLALVDRKLTALHPHIVNAGMVDHIDKAFAAGRLFRKEGVDLIFLYVTTYALSATVLPVVQQAKVPVVILALTPEAAIDYGSFNALEEVTSRTGEWLAHCAPCTVPELANVFNRTGIDFHQVTGRLHNDEAGWKEIREWIAAAKVAHTLAYNRMGCLGHYYGGMLDIYTDLTQIYACFGGHIELLEVEELAALRKQVREVDITQQMDLFRLHFDLQQDCAPDELRNAAITSVALEQLATKYQLGSLVYYYKGTGQPEHEEAIRTIILGNSLLTARGIPVAGEYEIKNAVAMKILDSLEAGGSFTEFYAMDDNDDVVLMGHDGPGHIAIAEGKTKVKPLREFHGKVGRGLSVEMQVMHGPVTLLSVAEKKGGGLLLLSAEGQSVPGPVLQIGNTNSRYQFTLGARRFVQQWNSQGPAHHCAVGIGHLNSQIAKLGKYLKLEVVQVC